MKNLLLVRDMQMIFYRHKHTEFYIEVSGESMTSGDQLLIIEEDGILFLKTFQKSGSIYFCRDCAFDLNEFVLLVKTKNRLIS